MKADRRFLEDLSAAVAAAGNGAIVIDELAIFPGANLYSPQPVMLCRFRLGDVPIPPAAGLRRYLADALGIEGIDDNAAQEEPDCAWLAALAGQAAAALLTPPLRDDVGGGGTEHEGTASCWVELARPGIAVRALRLVLVALAAALAGRRPERDRQVLGMLRRLCETHRTNLSSRVLIRAARARGIPFLPVAAEPSLWQFGWGERSLCFWETSSNADGLLALNLAVSKQVAKRLFVELGLPTPAWRVVGPDDDFRPAVDAIGFPCAIKPVDRGKGLGVSANIRSMADAEQAVAFARRFSRILLIEEHVPGTDYRLMVADGRLIAAVARRPPEVIGDGATSLGSLIDAYNRPRQRPLHLAGYLVPVARDAALAACLASQGMTIDSIPPAGRRIVLRTNANRSTGATCEDVLAKVHPVVRQQAVHAAAAFGFRVTGIDYVTPDIARSPEEAGGGYLEANATPGTPALLAAGMDEVELGSLILGEMPAAIPVTLLLADDPLAETVRTRLGERLTGPGEAASGAAWACIGSLPLDVRRLNPVEAARAPLRHRSVARLTILWTRSDLEELGLPLDRFDRIIAIGRKPAEPWMSLLARSCAKVQTVRTADAAFSRAGTEASA